MIWECISGWIEHHPGLAAWIQAIFSVAAIAAAGWFPLQHEKNKEKSIRKNALVSLLHLTSQLLDIQQRILKTLQNEGHQQRWVEGDYSKDLRLLNQLASELPASMLVGFEMTYLADLRAGCAHAIAMDKILEENDFGKIKSYYDYPHLLVTHNRHVDKAKFSISLLENEISG